MTQRGAWKPWLPWLLCMMNAVEQTAHYTNGLIDGIMDQMSATLDYGKAELKWYTKEINEALFAQPYLKPKVIGEIMGRTTLTKYMGELTRLGILTAKPDKKEVFYVNSDLVRILATD